MPFAITSPYFDLFYYCFHGKSFQFKDRLHPSRIAQKLSILCSGDVFCLATGEGGDLAQAYTK